MRRIAPAVVLTAVALLGSCAKSGKPASPSQALGPTQPCEETKAMDTKPKVCIPDGSPPAKLVVDDIVTGNGAEATSGKHVTVQYVGVSWSTHKQFDASWDRGEPFDFDLGAGSVIKGWDQGVAGMKVGGRRKLTIPPDLGYGKTGSPPVIAPNETLVFVVDLLDVK
jgi:peptidylprolyl isomerase